ncbi:hypothetical protein UFOVP761_32 [uncultured Caudovirales phage]|uniref:Uncharacterized protein n=1 Tax=uncultured Caudovirales phage TaxID=2100421 RepID=A0A6J5NVT3_9CAUD|nr:hypothetical protein UFOVP761_32 [uncultured Caudovirales phage]
MPTYTINGKRVKTETALTDDQIDEIAADLGTASAPTQPKRSALSPFEQGALNVYGGLIRGAGSIGSTILWPIDKAQDLYYGDRGPTVNGLITGQQPLSRNEERRRQIDEGVQNLFGSDPESTGYSVGKLASEVAGTAGLGPLMAGGARAVPVLARFAPALETGGLAPQMERGVTNMLTRAGAGAATGGAATLAVDPSQTAAGAGFGAAFGLGAPVVNALGRFAGKAVERGYRGSKARALLTAAEGRGQDIVDILRGNVELVPGSLPTAGEAAAPLNLTRYSALQQTASERVPELVTPYFQRAQQQEAARKAAVQAVGRTPAELAAAKAARSAEGNRLYKLAEQGLLQTDDTLLPLLGRPSMNKAFDHAAKLAKEAGEPFVIGKNVPEQVIPSSILDEFGNPVGETVIPAQAAEFPVKSLHYVKLALDDLLKNPKEFGIAATEARMIGDTRKQFINWLETNSPEYGQARTAFAEASKPINQMEIGQYLESKLTSGLGQERAQTFATAVKNAPGTIKSAVTGAPRAKDLSEMLTPDQLKAVQSVQEDLERGVLFESQARAASRIGPTAEKAATSASAEASGGAMPSFLSRVQTVANALMKRITTGMDRKLAIEIATEMLDPKLAADAMEKALAREAKIQGAKRVVGNVTGFVPKAVTSATAVNMLRPQSSNNNALAE